MAFTVNRRTLEPRWVSEYCAVHYPKAEVRLSCPLGGIPKETLRDYGVLKGLRVYRPWRPEVDALVILQNMLILVEAKIFKYMDGLSKLPVYKSLVPQTPELSHVANRPIYMKLLIPYRIPWVLEAAKDLDVTVEVWVPDFVKQAWDERDKYWTKEAIEKREARKEKLKELGYR
jgi:hypothetical protein